MIFLWRKVYSRSLAGAKMIQYCYKEHQRLLRQGSTINLLGYKRKRLTESGKIKKEAEVSKWIFAPKSKFKQIW